MQWQAGPDDLERTFAIAERHAQAVERASSPGLERKTLTSNPITRARLGLGVEEKHRFGALNSAQEGRIRKHLDALDRAHDQGDVATARSHTAALRSYLDGLGAPDNQDDEDQDTDVQAKTPRRSRGNVPTIDHIGGDSTGGYEQMSRDLHLVARVARYRQTFAGR